ncbi:crossover junction endonuclease MUS81 isoform X2 [Hippopotamus amphibius kiboko]|uniref:crossover junction endonuclease MUS81 isoform X2 n=1 Tax=Hippopotamus amphibius kiboko TaxID=575201 RepID=UPI002597B2B4|nr:crossover junction endonuclease MUS81 isoform X2 [Hippopotamus amphibius kiboko]
MAASVRLGRKRPLPVCPNPLFVRWLTEWRDEAASRGRRTQFVFQKALRSLRRYPLPLRSGKEAKILQHFGDGLCRMLDQRLQQHKASGDDHALCSPSGAKSPAPERPPSEVQDPSMPVPTQLKAGGSGSYWPARHSGARAVLLLLYREHLNPSSHGFLTKEELLQSCAQKAPRVAPGSARPWPALRSLLRRNLVLRTHQPARYSLTPAGLELAQKLVELEGLSLLNVGSGPEEPPGEEPEMPGAASAELGTSEGSVQQPLLELGPGEYKVLLCVDVGETKGAGHRPELLRELQRLHVTHTVRKLHVGDFVWVAQETRPRDPAQPGELVLDHIVERKRLDDLCSSIIDGRFREQKFRLKRCGLGHRVYLVEECGSVHSLSLPESTLRQAVTNTQVIDGFFVKRTADIKESAAYLALLTRGLQRLYQAQSVREVFARQLMQVRGVSGEKAAALVERYSTPASLLAAYDACATPKEQETLLSTVKCGPLQRNLGPALSRTLSQLYCSSGPLT